MSRLYWRLASRLDLSLHEARALVREAVYGLGALLALSLLCLLLLGA